MTVSANTYITCYFSTICEFKRLMILLYNYFLTWFRIKKKNEIYHWQKALEGSIDLFTIEGPNSDS